MELLMFLLLQGLVRGNAYCGPPSRRFGHRTGVFVLVLLVLVVLQHAGIDVLTALGLVVVASCLTAEVATRVFGLPPLTRSVA